MRAGGAYLWLMPRAKPSIGTWMGTWQVEKVYIYIEYFLQSIWQTVDHVGLDRLN
jgi:hypothetical protein